MPFFIFFIIAIVGLSQLLRVSKLFSQPVSPISFAELLIKKEIEKRKTIFMTVTGKLRASNYQYELTM
jgi:hypothetical protein